MRIENINRLPKPLLLHIFTHLLRHNGINQIKDEEEYKQSVKLQQEQKSILLRVCKLWKEYIESTPKLNILRNVAVNFRHYLEKLSLPRLTKMIIDYGLVEREIKNCMERFDKTINSNEFLRDFFHKSFNLDFFDKIFVNKTTLNIDDETTISHLESQPLLDKKKHKSSTNDDIEMMSNILKTSITYNQVRTLADFSIVSRTNNLHYSCSKRVGETLDAIYKKFEMQVLENYDTDNFKNKVIDEKAFKAEIVTLFKDIFNIKIFNEGFENRKFFIKKLITIFYNSSTQDLLIDFKKRLTDLNIYTIAKPTRDGWNRKKKISLYGGGLFAFGTLGSALAVVLDYHLTLHMILFGCLFGLSFICGFIVCFMLFRISRSAGKKLEQIMKTQFFNLPDTSIKALISSTADMLNFLKEYDQDKINFAEYEEVISNLSDLEKFYFTLASERDFCIGGLDSVYNDNSNVFRVVCNFSERIQQAINLLSTHVLNFCIIKEAASSNDAADIMQLNPISFFGRMKVNSEKMSEEPLLPKDNDLANDEESSEFKIIN